MIFIRKFDTTQDKAEATLVYPNTNYIVATDVVAIEATGATHDYSQDYTTFNVTTAGTFKLYGNGIDYSTDNGQNWTSLANNTDSPTIPAGTKVRLKRTHGNGATGRFITTAEFTVEGNAMSLVYGDNFTGQTSLNGKNSVFENLFSGCTGLTSAENFILPATELAQSCYKNMFSNSNITAAPALPATTLATRCYQAMFQACKSLTSEGLPALPATTLAQQCYDYMFDDCDAITTAPVLPATSLVSGCYNNMLKNCELLSYVECYAESNLNSNNLSNWLQNVSSTGTFVKKSGITWPSGASGIPTNWTVRNV